jgi:hypothetical protein
MVQDALALILAPTSGIGQQHGLIRINLIEAARPPSASV